MKKLYLLPFDHRQTFLKIIKASTPPTKKDIQKAKDYKKIIYQAYLQSLKKIKKQNTAILVDPWLGKEILLDAHKKNITTALALEKSHQKEFQFEKNYRKQLQKLKPTYAKVLVRYNPQNKALNQRQAKKLAHLNHYLKNKKTKFLFELLVPPTPQQLKKAGSKQAYDHKIRPQLTLQALKELQKAKINPDIWKLEGLDLKEQLQKIIQQVKSFNPQSKIIILGRGENKQEVKHWLKVAAPFREVIGFAIGRTIFQKPLQHYQNKKLTKNQTINKISRNYLYFINLFDKIKKIKHG